MDIKIQTPPVFGSVQEVYRYLYQLSEALNASSSAMETRTDAQIASAMRSAGQASMGELTQQAAGLRNLIRNTAEIVRTEMDTLETELKGRIQAESSRFGTVTESLSQTITATAAGIRQEFRFDSRIQALQGQAGEFSDYMTSTQGYIRSGVIYEEGDTPVFGIAIGQGLKTTTVTIDGAEYQQIDSSQSCAFYTSEKLEFRLNGHPVAWFSNRGLHCGDIEISGTAKLGGCWEIKSNGHLTIRWAGGV